MSLLVLYLRVMVLDMATVHYKMVGITGVINLSEDSIMTKQDNVCRACQGSGVLLYDSTMEVLSKKCFFCGGTGVVNTTCKDKERDNK